MEYLHDCCEDWRGLNRGVHFDSSGHRFYPYFVYKNDGSSPVELHNSITNKIQLIPLNRANMERSKVALKPRLAPLFEVD